MTDINITATTPSVITATLTTPDTITLSVSSPSTVTVTASVGNVGDMTKAVYDTDNSGVVDNAAALGGVAASGFVQTASTSWIDLTDGGATTLHTHAGSAVTSIATTAPITGGPITSTGTIGIDAATTLAAGSMSASDKSKLDGIEAGAEANNISDVNATDLTDGGATSLHSHANDHARQHAITSTSDHTSTATSGQILKADANGLPVNATNTDAQVSAAVTASHAAVTVADSASIDMTLTGQQVSAAAIFGTGAGVVAEGNHTHSSYYTLQYGVSAGWNPVDSTTYYFGGNWLQNGTAARTRLYIPMGGTIVYASFNSFVGTTLGSAETSSAWVRLNNTTDTLISSAIQQDAAYEQFINSSLSITVVAGDYVEIKWTSPAWTTNPTNTRQFGTIMVRV